MAAGEYISMQSQRELFERQIALERAELEAMPEEEQARWPPLYRPKGFPPDEAERSRPPVRGPERRLDTLIREELGLDPTSSVAGRARRGLVRRVRLGAVVPGPAVPPRVGPGAFVARIVLSLVALFAVGAGVSLLTGRGFLFSGARQV
jgi:VIT1/CCC1 family predicted Fe2+/Mn2+ transporter